MTIGSRILDCQHGPDRKKNAKDKFSRRNAKLMAINYFCKNQKPEFTTNHKQVLSPKLKDVDIRNHMYKATLKQMLCKVDQINLEEKIKTWVQEDPENHFFFRPCSLSPTEGVSEYCSNPDGHVEAQIIQNLIYLHIKQPGRGT